MLQGVHKLSCFPTFDLRHMTAQQLHLSIFLATLQQRKWVNGEALATDGPSFVLCQDLSKRTIQHPTMAPFYHELRLCSSLWTALEHVWMRRLIAPQRTGSRVCAHQEKMRTIKKKILMTCWYIARIHMSISYIIFMYWCMGNGKIQ